VDSLNRPNSGYGFNIMQLLIIILTFYTLACNNRNNSEKLADPSPDKSIDKSKFYIKGDSITIYTDNNDSILYSAVDFNAIVDNFPRLYDQIPKQPDISYAESGYFKDITTKNGMKKHLSFGSEAGQDQYFILYSYFLKKNNSGDPLETRRRRLLSIFQTINEIYSFLSNGGTFFGHQYKRIPAYVEYNIYQYKNDYKYYDKVNNVEKQKNLYLSFFRQSLKDQTFAFHESGDKSNNSQYELLIGKLDSLITDFFYLKKASEFQFTNY
jgi:hypothetical protein